MALQGGSLAVGLLFELLNLTFLKLKLLFKFCDLFPLEFDEGIHAAGLSIAAICRTFPGNRLIVGVRRYGSEEEKGSDCSGEHDGVQNTGCLR
ncbi:MAG TPA: hypothetical protein VLS44_06810 [Nitrospira sp.]|nr:hypothetical protein [Nitrospira sp.]